MVCRVDGVELLEDALRRGKTGSDDDDSDEEVDDEDDKDGGMEDQQSEDERDEENNSDATGSQLEAIAEGDEEGSDLADDSDEGEQGDNEADVESEDDAAGQDEAPERSRSKGGGKRHARVDEAEPSKPKLDPCAGSLKQLKQQLAQAKAAKAQAKCPEEGIPGGGEAGESQETAIPLEQTRILTQEDFERIRKLKARVLCLYIPC